MIQPPHEHRAGPAHPSSDAELLFDASPTRVVRTRGADGRPVVIKSRAATDDAGIANLQHEFRIAQALMGANVIKAYALDSDADASFMVLEDFGGQSLDRILGERRLGLDEVLSIGVQIAAGLADIHAADVIHKDITPENIVYNPDSGIAKIIDFGISTQLTREQAEMTSPVLLEGSLRYLSPEQTGRMNRAIDYRTDLYSLGATLYELLTGRPLFDVQEPIEWLHCHIARQPRAPHDLDPSIPRTVSDIVMKLLAKSADERYRSARGIRADLARCLEQLNGNGIEAFPIAALDPPVRFQIPQRLYGRDDDVAQLMRAFERVAGGRGRAPELVLVAGYSGIGKSGLVKELYRPVTERRGYFVAGKFDQLHRTVPLAAPVGALRALVRQLLTEPEARLVAWRERLAAALGDNGRLVADLIPELELITGPLAEPPELSGRDAEVRFNRTVIRFIGAFCSADHPLVLFLDDLQWADSATFALLEQLFADPAAAHLLIIGAYRDNEVHAAHPLMLMTGRLTEAGTRITTQTLSPLSCDHLAELLAESLDVPEPSVAELASLLEQKTAGNPFFAGEFLRYLHEQDLIALDGASGRWAWDVDRIGEEAITDNVVDLMSAKLRRLSQDTQRLLQRAACIGHRFDLGMLTAIYDGDRARLSRSLGEAMGHGLVAPLGGRRLDLGADPTRLRGIELAFAHDRIQQAAHDLLDPEARQRTHLEIAENLIGLLDPQGRSEQVFRITDHLNCAADLITDANGRMRQLSFNCEAGRQAERSAAYDAAYGYFARALSLLPDDAWSEDPDHTREIHEDAADAALSSGRYEACDRILAAALGHVSDPIAASRLNRILLTSLGAQGRHPEVLLVGKRLVAAFGQPFPMRASRARLLLSFIDVQRRLRRRSLDDLRNLPESREPGIRERTVLSERVAAAAHFAEPELLPLMVLHGIRSALKWGIHERSIISFSGLSVMLCTHLRRFEEAERAAAFALELCERYPAARSLGRVQFNWTGFAAPWRQPLAAVTDELPRVYEQCIADGDFEGAAQAATYQAGYVFAGGAPLSKVADEVARWRGAVGALNQRESEVFLDLLQQLVENLRGQAEDPARLCGRFYDFERMMPDHERTHARRLSVAALTRQASLLNEFGHVGEALACADRVRAHLASFENVADGMIVHQIDALIRLRAVIDPDHPLDGRARRRLLRQVRRSRRILALWADAIPENALARRELVEAEWQRANGRPDLAQDHFDRAVEAARAHGLTWEEASANRLCGEMHQSLGRTTIARAYLHQAHDAYRRWGAHALTARLELEHPGLQVAASQNRWSGPGSTSGTPQSDLDVSALMKALKAIADETVYSRMLGSIISTAIEFAGAQRGVLMLRHWSRDSAGAEFRVEAEACVDGGAPQVLQSRPVESFTGLSHAVVNYVARTRRSVVIHDARQPGSEIPGLSLDTHVLDSRVSSILCLPIVAAADQEAELIGLLYLENNRASHTFTEQRFDTLEIIVMAAAGRLELSRKAALDGLTQLFNRDHFQTMLRQELARSQRHGRPLALILADIDHFKRFNDTWGHQVGDEVLIAVAGAVRDACRDADVAARYGGEELAVILPDTDAAGALVVAERIRRSVAGLGITHMGEDGEQTLSVTLSLGVADLNGAVRVEADLLRLADEALYQAKGSGRNQVACRTRESGD